MGSLMLLRAGGPIFNGQDAHLPFEQRDDARRGLIGTVEHDRRLHRGAVLRRHGGKRLGPDALAAQHRGDAIEGVDLVLVTDDDGAGPLLVDHRSAPVSDRALSRLIMSCSAAPGDTIGYTVPSCSTWKSITTAPAAARAWRSASAMSARLVTRIPGRPCASASFT